MNNFQKDYERNLDAMLKAIEKFGWSKDFWLFVQKYKNPGKITMGQLAEQYCLINYIPWKNFLEEVKQ